MKNLFTGEELECGMFIIKNSAGRPFEDLAYARTVTYKIGFSPNRKDEDHYGLCSVMTDGFYANVSKSLKGLAEHLNKDEHGYRPLTKEELFQLVNSSNQGFY